MLLRNKRKLYVEYLPITIAVIWFILHVLLAYNRSISSDEGAKVDWLSFSILKALYMQMSEYAPYTPFDMLFGKIADLLVGKFLPLELWSRIPSCFFGALTVFLGAEYARRYDRWLLVGPLFFSVTLTSFACQYQPIAALINSGAVLYLSLLKPDLINGLIMWVHIFAGHIFGICNIGLGALLRKPPKIKIVLSSFLMVASILIIHKLIQRPFSSLTAEFPHFIDVVKQILGAFSNPHKASYLVFPVSVVGIFRLAKRDINTLWKIVLYFSATVFLPLGSLLVSHYQFLPRYIVGGLFGYLVLFAEGGAAIFELKVFPPRLIKSMAFAATLIASAGTWSLYIMGVPPFVDQPLHKLHRIVEKWDNDQMLNVLLVESGMAGSYKFYLDKKYGFSNRTLESHYQRGIK